MGSGRIRMDRVRVGDGVMNGGQVELELVEVRVGDGVMDGVR